MVEVKVYKGGSVATQDVDAGAFGAKVLGRTLKDAVVMYEANQRQGTVRAKTRSQVRGGNTKLYPQKHTGRARMGTTKSPIWRGGGRIHPPQPRDLSYSMPKKARRVALRNAIFTKFRDGEVGIADGWPADVPSTKSAIAILSQLDMGRSVTVVTDGADKTVYKSLRNVPLVDVACLDDLNARQVLLRRYLVLTPAAYESLEKRFAQTAGDKA
jgi:large subunit ribosomal protein L4